MNRRLSGSELVWKLDTRSLVPALLFVKCCHIYEQEKSMGTRSHKSGSFSAVPHKGDTGMSLSKSFQDSLLTDHMKNKTFMQKWKNESMFFT
jgi:hypothetical protein